MTRRVRLLGGGLPVAGLLALLAGPAAGQTQYWDGPNTTPQNTIPGASNGGRGGSGTWDGSTTNWTNIGGLQNNAWGSLGAVFRGAPGTVTLTGTRVVGGSGIEFGVAGYTLTGGILNMDGTITLPTGTTTIASSIVAGTLALRNGGTLILSGPTVNVNSMVISGGLTVTLATSNFNLGSVDAAGGTLRFAHGGNASIGGINGLGGGGAVVFDSGQTIMSGVGGFTGSYTVNNGATLVVTGLTLGSSTMTIAAGGTLGGNGSVTSPLTSSGTIAPSGGALTTGPLTLNGGALTFDLAALPASTNDSISVLGNLTVAGATTVNINALAGFGAGTYTLMTHGGTATGLSNLALGTTPGGFTSTLNTGVAGSVQLVVSGAAGTQFWDGGNTSAGNTANGRGGSGTWNVGNANWTNAAGSANAVWGSGTGVFAGSAGTVNVSGAHNIDTLQFSTTGYVLNNGTLNLTGSGIIRVDPGVTASIRSRITGGTLVKNDAGTLALANDANSMSGVTLNAGTLEIAGSPLGTGTLNFNGGTLAVSALQGTGGVRGPIILGAAGGTLRSGSGSISTQFLLNGNIAGAGALTLFGGGSFSLTGNATHTGGTIISEGVLIIGDAQSVSSTGSLSGNVVNNGGLSFGRTDATTFSGNISGTGLVSMRGTLTLTGSNTYSGTTSVGGTLRLAGNGTVGTGTIVLNGGTLQTFAAGADVTLANAVGTTFTGGALLADGRNLTLNGALSGSGALSVSSTGGAVVSFEGSNTYSGAMQITAGQTRFNGSFGSTSATVQVGNGATLGGTGSFAGAVSVAGGGIIAPGNSVGTLTLRSLTLAAGSVLNMEVGAPPTSDNIVVYGTGALTVAGATTINVADAGGFGAGTYTLISYGGTATGLSNLVLGTTPGGFTSTLNTGVAGQVQLVASTAGGAVQFWDGGNTTAGNLANGRGGTGTWDGTTTNWTNAAGSANSTWASTTGVFAGTAGTVTLSGTRSFDTLQFSTTGYTLTSGRLTAAGNGIIRVDPGLTATIDSEIEGVRLVKNDSGTLVLNGGLTMAGLTINGGTVQIRGANTYVGGTEVNAGATLRLDTSGGGFPAAGSGSITLNGGSIGPQAESAVFNALGISNAITLGSGGGTLLIGLQPNGSSRGTILNGVISGSGGLTIANNPSVVANDTAFVFMAANNSHTGGTTIGTGVTLQLGQNSTSGSLTGAVVNNGELRFRRSDAVIFAGDISGTGRLDVRGGGVTLTGNNTYSGGTRIGDGGLTIAGAANLGSGPVLLFGPLNVTGSTELTNAIAVETIGIFAPASGTVLRLSGVLSGDQADTPSFAGPGTVLLTNAGNALAGGFRVSGGALRVLNAGAAGSGTITLDGGTLGLANGISTLSHVTLSNRITLGAGGGTVTGGNTGTFDRSLTLSGVISGAGALNVSLSGAQSVVLTAANTYTGGTTVAGNSLVLGNGGNILGNVTNNGLFNFDRSDSVTFAGNITGGGGLGIRGGGTVTLTGTNTYSGTNTLSGFSTLVIGSAGNIGTGLIQANGVTLRSTASLALTNDIALFSGGLTLAPDAGTTLTLPTGISSGAGGPLAVAGPGTVVVTGGSISGGLQANGGTTRLTGTFTAGNSSVGAAGTLAGTGTLNAALTSAGTIAPGGGVLSTGALTLTGGALNFALGATGAPGNDRIAVTGNLAVTGATTVNASNAGGFGQGTYTLVTYTGTASGLSNLALGALPSGFGGTLSTATAGQVQLVSTRAQFWDGGNTTPGNTANGRGGDGTWSAAGTNWTNSPGSANSAFEGVTGVFATGGGNVTVDGTQSFGTLQFSIAGYTLSGGTLNATGPGIIRVDAGSGAIINSTISGAGLVINDAGSLVLGGANTVGAITVNGGTLAITSGQALGSGTLTLNGGMLAPFRSGGNVTIANAIVLGAGGGTLTNGFAATGPGVLEFSGPISGAGALTIATAPNRATPVFLTGAATHTGGTTINSGATLTIGHSGTSGSLAGDVVNNGSLVFQRTDATTHAGNISGGGSVMISEGRVSLTGSNSYTGDTIVSATLVLAAAGNIGPGTLRLGGSSPVIETTASMTVANAVGLFGGANTFRADAGTVLRLDGALSGNGALRLDGAGTVVLGHAANNIGPVEVTGGGTLGVLNGGGAGSNAITLNNATLALANGAQAGTTLANAITLAAGGARIDTGGLNLVLTGAMTGAGGFTKQGAGELAIQGGNYTGATLVQAGTLRINGAGIPGSAVTVSGGAALAGNANLGSLTMLEGATLAPGNSIGTVTVNGNLVLAPGSTFLVESNPNGQADRVNVTGTATITGAVVRVQAGNFGTGYGLNTSYTILSAAGGRSGTFASVSTDLAFLTPALSYTPTDAVLTLTRNALDFSAVAATPNQRAVAGALDRIALGSALATSFLPLSAAQARAGMDALSGEVHVSALGGMLEESRIIRGAVLGRTREAAGGTPIAAFHGVRVTAWMQGLGAWGAAGGDGNAAGLRRSLGGVLAGADLTGEQGQWRIGVFAGGTSGVHRVPQRQGSRADLAATQFGAYGMLHAGPVRLTAGLAAFSGDAATSRGGFAPVSGASAARYGTSGVQVFGEAAWRMQWRQLAVEPFWGLAYATARGGAFTETGTGNGLLSAGGRSASQGWSTLGVRVESSIALGGMVLTPRASLAWQRALGGDVPRGTLNLQAGGGGFGIAGAPMSRDAVLIEAGAELRITPGLRAHLGYVGMAGTQGAREHAVRGGISWSF